MDFVKGIDALKLLKRNRGVLAIPKAVGLVCQLLEALDYAHKKGFVHRDIKPANLMLSKRKGNLFVHVADFGLARTHQSSRMSGLTMMGDVGGTVAYMPPEQITHYRDSKPAADQYSAAATLYQFLTNKFIYDLPKGLNEQLATILQKDPVPIGTRREDIPVELSAIIHRALSREPQDRFKDAGDMRTALLPFC